MNGQHLTLVKPLTLELKLGVNVRGKETLPFDWLRKRGRRLTDAGEGIKTGATQCSNQEEHPVELRGLMCHTPADINLNDPGHVTFSGALLPGNSIPRISAQHYNQTHHSLLQEKPKAQVLQTKQTPVPATEFKTGNLLQMEWLEITVKSHQFTLSLRMQILKWCHIPLPRTFSANW